MVGQGDLPEPSLACIYPNKSWVYCCQQCQHNRSALPRKHSRMRLHGARRGAAAPRPAAQAPRRARGAWAATEARLWRERACRGAERPLTPASRGGRTAASARTPPPASRGRSSAPRLPHRPTRAHSANRAPGRPPVCMRRPHGSRAARTRSATTHSRARARWRPQSQCGQAGAGSDAFQRSQQERGAPKTQTPMCRSG